uniref:F-box domain-containing protein n=1 Tax=Meloidogyne incognita TaxID=6306 RepID=A0A914LMD9_MELIC
MNLLPAETNLDILKCFNFNQLNNFQLSNRYFCELINNYNKELAVKVFYSVELVVWKNYVCKDLEYSRKELDLNLNEEIKLKVHSIIGSFGYKLLFFSGKQRYNNVFLFTFITTTTLLAKIWMCQLMIISLMKLEI